MTDLPILEVEDRLLWPDGTISVSPKHLNRYVLKLAQKGKLQHVAVTELSPEVISYNSVADITIDVKTSIDESKLELSWSLPDSYKYLDLDEYLIGLGSKIERDHLYEQRLERLAHEIYVFKKLQLEDVLRMLIYMVDQLTKTQAVWGVGRGSSCSSYLLFLIGLHEVDPVRYDIDLADFIRKI